MVKNTFFCVAEESSPIHQRARAKTAGASADLTLEMEAENTEADTSEGTSEESSSSIGFAFDEEDSGQLAQCFVKNTFICVEDDRSPANPKRARANTAHVTTTWEEDLEDDDDNDVDSDAVPMMHIATHWSFGDRDIDHPGATPPVFVFEDEESCEHAQSILETSGAAGRQKVLAFLRGRVREAAKSAYAHKVLEAVVLYTGTDDAAFIADELLGLGRESLLEAFTSSVICRMLEHSPADSRTIALMDELLSSDVAGLCTHKNGHNVAAAMIAHGIPRQAAQVVSALHSNPQRFSRHRFASKVVKVALEMGSDSLAQELMSQPGTVGSLACHNFGVDVVRALLQSPRHSPQVWRFLVKSTRRLFKDKYGRELMRDLGFVPGMELA